MKLYTYKKKILADLFTPVGAYLKIRELYSQVLLLESSDYAGKDNAQSFICFSPLAGLSVEDYVLETYIGQERTSQKFDRELPTLISDYVHSFSAESEIPGYNGFFGYTTFDCVQYFDTVKLKSEELDTKIKDVRYDLYEYIIEFDHFHEEITILKNTFTEGDDKLEDIEQILRKQDNSNFSFSLQGEVHSPLQNEEHKNNVQKGKQHCHRGDVFQVVLAKRFQQAFQGDDFNVYRALRSINPSPYLFYFDYTEYRLFGSSPEAQIIVKDELAEIHPIAGTMPRTRDSSIDLKNVEKLKSDPKENAEHVMLVDLARNDLSKNCDNVEVIKYKEVQWFSHVMHLTSKVQGRKHKEITDYQIFADTFPAGTLSGAPKYRALEIIDELEPHRRGFYGGSIGSISLNGGLNHAIMIRSFLSKENTLYFQAGGGIVIDSDEEMELQEVNNKLAALRKALVMAENI
jgi:anthranilate synthase component 1